MVPPRVTRRSWCGTNCTRLVWALSALMVQRNCRVGHWWANSHAMFGATITPAMTAPTGSRTVARNRRCGVRRSPATTATIQNPILYLFKSPMPQITPIARADHPQHKERPEGPEDQIETDGAQEVAGGQEDGAQAGHRSTAERSAVHRAHGRAHLRVVRRRHPGGRGPRQDRG